MILNDFNSQFCRPFTLFEALQTHKKLKQTRQNFRPLHNALKQSNYTTKLQYPIAETPPTTQAKVNRKTRNANAHETLSGLFIYFYLFSFPTRAGLPQQREPNTAGPYYLTPLSTFPVGGNRSTRGLPRLSPER